jgi:hypothetical protein
VYNSRYMQEAYRAHAGFAEKRGSLRTRRRKTHPGRAPPRPATARTGLILCTTDMGRHKNANAAARAARRADRAAGPAGVRRSWPVPATNANARAGRPRRRGRGRGIRRFPGRERLDALCVRARAFCDSGANRSAFPPRRQLFGTPVVSSTVWRAEICGRGPVREPDECPRSAALRTLLERRGGMGAGFRRRRGPAARVSWTNVRGRSSRSSRSWQAHDRRRRTHRRVRLAARGGHFRRRVDPWLRHQRLGAARFRPGGRGGAAIRARQLFPDAARCAATSGRAGGACCGTAGGLCLRICLWSAAYVVVRAAKHAVVPARRRWTSIGRRSSCWAAPPTSCISSLP